MNLEALSGDRNSPEAVSARFEQLDPSVKAILDHEFNKINLGREIFTPESLKNFTQQERRSLSAIIADLHLHKGEKEIIKKAVQDIKNVVS